MVLAEVAPTAGLAPHLRDLLTWPQAPRALESAICKAYGLPDIDLVSTGTAALVVAFLALKRRAPPQRRVVIVPAYTCPLVVIAAHAAGLTCVACDTVPDGFDLDLDHLAALAGPETLCVVPAHYGGWLTDVARVAAALPAGVAIVEDAAQAFGATWGDASAGTAGDIGIYSFGVGKGFTLFEAGAFTARDPELMQLMRALFAEIATPSLLAELGCAVALVGYHALYTPGGLALLYGRPKRAALAVNDDIEAAGDAFDLTIDIRGVGGWRKAVGLRALPRLEPHIAASRARFARLAQLLNGVQDVRVHVPPAAAHPLATSLFFSLPETPAHRRVMLELWRSPYGVAKLFSRAIGDYPYLQPLLQPSQTPHARALAATTMTLSTHAGLSAEAEAAILAALKGGST